ncbi:MAG: radical SAM protein [Sedimentisphaerales bacterium]|nr:radical SAM protein [Sedimentisphaerales bacterium]
MSPVKLDDNVVNHQLGPAEPKFKIWSSAGLMVTYWCSSSCVCCYVYSSPQANEAHTEMTPEMAIQCWQDVIELAGPKGKVHLTGGEPFGNYERLRQILQLACEEKLSGLEKIETNAYWCTDENLVRRRLKELKALGLKKLQISTDIYHQEYVPIEKVQMAIKVGREVLGDSGLQVRWRDYLDNPVSVKDLTEIQRKKIFAQVLAIRAERLLGRAADELVSLFPANDYTSFIGSNCRRNLLGARHVHIDGAGNVFIGTCIGIIAGRIDSKKDQTLSNLWRNFDYRIHPIISVLVNEGPAGLMEYARSSGYRDLSGYASKCHLCFDIRRFLFRKGLFTKYLGPEVTFGLCHLK